jgi:hypothetical protein
MMFGTNKLIPAVAIELARLDRDANRYGTFWIVGACLAALATLLLPGCSNSSTAHAVNVPQARDALKIALDEWKKGETIKAVQTSSTPLIVQDLDWSSGAKLIDYEILGDGQPEDASLRLRVKLTMNGGPAAGKNQGKAAEKSVWYLVTTSPKVTVFRDMLRR